ncbi:hypothetical protein P168DRAFT_2227 [Aspergillus campestris IBT 28561]|uniref:Uncharacterized protein n=1 Tax=Aspergillus campestris (strain IBT 28561) TaxID=1392248 RepID=A0A2I1DD31_ASPC2|nr:uncharacterized protein P168DRAFT_2227 [Aspergillus campestris IBT 28561]PKY07777.1 hypothetical protein P168DRAFT_2227 [Aspergillus campestris IBT 28561]
MSWFASDVLVSRGQAKFALIGLHGSCICWCIAFLFFSSSSSSSSSLSLSLSFSMGKFYGEGFNANVLQRGSMGR